LFGPHLHGAQRGGRVRGEVGVAGAAGEDHRATLLEVADGPPPDEGFGDRPHLDRGEEARLDAVLFERVLQGEAVDDGGQHAHVVGRRAIHAPRARREAAKDVAAADDDTGLNAQGLDLGNVFRDAGGDRGIDAVGLVTHERLAGQLQKDALVGRLGRVGHGEIIQAASTLIPPLRPA
jgi:hypothetical protein